MARDHSIQDHNVIVGLFEVRSDTTGFKLHELLSKSIHECDLVALNELRAIVTDIVVR